MRRNMQQVYYTDGDSGVMGRKTRHGKGFLCLATVPGIAPTQVTFCIRGGRLGESCLSLLKSHKDACKAVNVSHQLAALSNGE